MAKALADIILSDPLVVALENRALREGLLSDQDYKLSEFVTPTVTMPNSVEGTALDLICLYEHAIVESKRFSFRAFAKSLGEGVIYDRGDNVREFSVAYRLGNQIEHQGMTRKEFEELKSRSAFEAQFILRRDVDDYIRDARAAFESEAPKEIWIRELSFSEEVSHRAAAEFLKQNLFWLVDVFEFAYGDGVYNRLVDVDDLRAMKLPKEKIRQFEFFSKCARFDAYFNFLQEAYVTLFENSFLGRVNSVEIAYERAPDRGLVASHGLSIDRLSRIIRVNLADVIDFFPLPRTIEEAIEFREHPRVRAFKRALDKWLRSFSDEPKLEAALRRELQLANRDITLLKHWRSIKENPIFFGVKMSAQAIPILGAAVTALDVVEYFLERHVSHRWAWVVAPQSRID